MTTGYVRLANDYQFNQDENKTYGAESYLRNDGHAAAVASLPTVGTTLLKDPDGTDVTSCICRSRVARYEGGDTNSIKWQFNFSTEAIPDPNTGKTTDPASRQFNMGQGAISISNSNAWTYTTSGNRIKSGINKIYPKGTITIPRGPLSKADNKTFWGVIATVAGKINSTVFPNDTADYQFRAGSVLFDGVSGGTKYINGVLKYQYEMRFQYMMLPDVASNDWNYLLDPNTGLFSLVNPALYGTADFNTLLP